MVKNIKLSIVFLNYNRLEDTMLTVSHLDRLCRLRKDIQVVAVDNGSSDGTASFLETQSDWITVILLKDNVGIAGLNIGFESSDGEYIFVLDDDSHPFDAATIDLIIKSLDNNGELGAIACRIECKNGKTFRTWHIPASEDGHICESIAFVGCGFAIRRELFRSVGWFPESYFLYQNEIEVAIKIRRLGYKIYYDPKCTVIHRNSPIGRFGWRQVFYPTRNSIWLLRKYVPFPLSIYYIFSRLCFGCIRAAESGEYGWYMKAVKESFQCKIKRVPLSADLMKDFTTLWHQNSLIHQIKWAIFG